MTRRLAKFAIAIALGATAAGLLLLADAALQAGLEARERTARAALIAEKASRKIAKLEMTGSLLANRVETQGDAALAAVGLEPFRRARVFATSRDDAHPLQVRATAVAIFSLAKTPGTPHAPDIVVGEDDAAAAAAQLAAAEDGKRLLRAARRADPNRLLSAITRPPAADADDKRFWLIWPLTAQAGALAVRLEIDIVADDVATVDLRAANTPADPLRAGPAAATLVSDKVLEITLRGAPALLARPSLQSAAIAFILGLLITIVALRLLNRNQVREGAQREREAEITRDIEEKQRELEASEARFRHLAESTNVTPWTADLDSQRFTYIGPQIEDLTGFPAGQWTVAGFWADHIHPADRRRVLFDEVPKIPLDHYHTIEYRVRAADGKVLSVRNMLTVVQDVQQIGGKRITRTLAQGFILDVTELKRAAAALEVAREKAEEANRVKSEFLANMSHELRTPLNAVIGFSEIMKDELFGPLDEQYREYATSIHASGRHLLDLINDVLDLSKIEAGRFELIAEETDLRGLLNECSVLLQERMQSAGLHGNYDIPDDLPPMTIDERRIKQVILNLLSNAIKFTPPGGSVMLAARRGENDGVYVSVRDTGIGMSAEEIPRALAKFGQIDGDLSRAHDGTGLGLPIAKSLIEMHGGKLEVASEKGKGTEMRIWLPPERVIEAAA